MRREGKSTFEIPFRGSKSGLAIHNTSGSFNSPLGMVISQVTMEGFERTPNTTLKRLPERGLFDRATVNAILDEAFICHVGFAVDGHPFVIPTSYARVGERLLIHGSAASRMLNSLSQESQTMTTRPDPTEYDPYFGKYIGLVPEGDIVTILSSQVEKTLAWLRTVPEEKAGHAYAPGKWSIKEVIGHVADTERIFAYRALRIGRNDKTPLAGFEQDDYVASTNFNARTLATLIEEFAAVRRATVQLCKHFTGEEWQRRGTANEREITTRAVAYNIAGHELHH